MIIRLFLLICLVHVSIASSSYRNLYKNHFDPIMRDYQNTTKDPYECIAKILYDPEHVQRINKMSQTNEDACKTNVRHSYLFSIKETNKENEPENKSVNIETRRSLSNNRFNFSEGRNLQSSNGIKESQFKPDLMQTIGVNKAILEFERLPSCWQSEILKCNPDMGNFFELIKIDAS